MMNRVLMLLGILLSGVASAASFSSLTVTATNGRKCTTDAPVVIFTYKITATCTSWTGACNDEVRLPISIPAGGTCRPRGAVQFEVAGAYFVGWFAKSVNWPLAPESWVEQVQKLTYSIKDQYVDTSSGQSELVADFYFASRAAGSPEYFVPETRYVEASVEVIAVDPDYSSSVAIDMINDSATDTGATASHTLSYTSSSGMDFSFAGLSEFSVETAQGTTSGGSDLGQNIVTFAYSSTPRVPSKGSVDLVLSCTAEGNRTGATQTTDCSAHYVAVFADTGILERQNTQPSYTMTSPEPLDPARFTRYIKGPAANGYASCALTGFSFAADSTHFKQSAIGAGVTDCDHPFSTGGSPIELLANGQEVDNANNGVPNQAPVATCPPPIGDPNACYDAYWIGSFALDSAILPP